MSARRRVRLGVGIDGARPPARSPGPGPSTLSFRQNDALARIVLDVLGRAHETTGDHDRAVRA